MAVLLVRTPIGSVINIILIRGIISSTKQYSHLDIKLNAFLLVPMDVPDTVLSLRVTLGPIRRQDGTRGLGQFSSTQSLQSREEERNQGEKKDQETAE